MISHSLSEREKKAIDAILSQAEEQYLRISDTSIQKIDDQCRSLWPDWNPKSLPNQNETLSSQIHNIDNIPVIQETVQEPIRNEISNLQKSPVNESNEKTNDMELLKKEAESLLNRISQTVEIENDPFEKVSIPDELSPVKKKKSNQEIYNEFDSNENQKDELNKRKKKAKKITQFSSTNSSHSDSLETPQSEIIRPKNKAQAKKVIASTSRQMKEIENENKMLKQRLAEMEISFNEAQKEIQNLKQALRKSEAIRAKLTNTSSKTTSNKKPTKPRKKLEYVNRF